ncbi:hypothetical protein B0H16DRAFT_100222 [Mycena metata]|uniref:Uncharacterized protein n=1 Tax=Mycena metata TaxID=1033252 RepID=A0AAD7I9Q9_9AGAR|nr:hypothetical protein B0H16DRAFT_100222 [Mycena metata]
MTKKLSSLWRRSISRRIQNSRITAIPTIYPRLLGAKIGRLYPSDPTQGSPFDTGTAHKLSPEYKRLAAFQGDLMFIGGRRYLREHASRTQNTWSWLSKLGKNASSLGATHTTDMGV